MVRFLFKYCLLIIGLCVATFCKAQLIVAEGFSAGVMVNNVLIGDGVETRNAIYTGYERSMALFENGEKAGLELDKGLILSSGVSAGAKGPNNTEGYTSGLGGPGHSILENIAGVKTMDAAELKFEFKPQTDEIVFRYIFASEEYKEWVDAGFNDIFGFFISGPGITGEQNVALVPGTNTVVSIDNVNHKRNTQYYVDNVDVNSVEHKYIQADGFTTVLSANLKLQACEWYTIKLAITDVGDPIKDSWVFVESKSFKHKTNLGEDTFFCDDGFIKTLDAGHPDKKVVWSTGDTSHQIQVSDFGTYWVEVFTSCGSFKDEIDIYPAISPIDLGDDTVACGNNFEMLLEIENRVFENYLWSTGATTPTLEITKPGTYWLTVTRNGCTDTDTIEIKEIQEPKFDFGNDTTFCSSDPITLTPGVSADSFKWSNGSDQSYIQVDKTGNYSLEIFKNGCSFSDTISLEFRDSFSIDIGPPSLTYCNFRDITLDTRMRDTASYSYSWSNGDTMPWTHLTEGGRYSIEVVDRECGFSSSDQITITILSEAQNFYVPNAFTPNGDHVNDSIKPIMSFTDLDDYSFSIYTLWGEKVFETKDMYEAWDGKIDGEWAPGNAFIWRAEIRTPCLPDTDQYKNGTLMLIR